MAVTPLPTPPSRQDPTTFSQRTDAFLGALPQYKNELDALGNNVENLDQGIQNVLTSVTSTKNQSDTLFNTSNDIVNDSQTYFNNAEQFGEELKGDAESIYDNIALFSNFKGEWSELTGSLEVPSIVRHMNNFWQLVENIANITLEEPSPESSVWSRATSAPVSNGDIGDIIYTPNDLETTTGKFLECDGRVLLQSAYPELFGRIGTGLVPFPTPFSGFNLNLVSQDAVYFYNGFTYTGANNFPDTFNSVSSYVDTADPARTFSRSGWTPRSPSAYHGAAPKVNKCVAFDNNTSNVGITIVDFNPSTNQWVYDRTLNTIPSTQFTGHFASSCFSENGEVVVIAARSGSNNNAANFYVYVYNQITDDYERCTHITNFTNTDQGVVVGVSPEGSKFAVQFLGSSGRVIRVYEINKQNLTYNHIGEISTNVGQNVQSGNRESFYITDKFLLKWDSNSAFSIYAIGEGSVTLRTTVTGLTNLSVRTNQNKLSNPNHMQVIVNGVGRIVNEDGNTVYLYNPMTTHIAYIDALDTYYSFGRPSNVNTLYKSIYPFNTSTEFALPTLSPLSQDPISGWTVQSLTPYIRSES